MADLNLVFAGKVNTVSQWTDVSGYGNHAIQNNPSWKPTIISGANTVAINTTTGGRAYYFDGAASPNADNFKIPYNSSLRFNDEWTLSFWINCCDLANQAWIFTNAYGSDTARIYIVIKTDGTIRHYARDNNNSYAAVESNMSVDDNLWHNIVCMRGDGYLWIYIDGVYDNKIAETLGDCGNSHNIYIGASVNESSNTSSNGLKGYMVAPRFWQRMLGVSEIVSNYGSSLLEMRG